MSEATTELPFLPLGYDASNPEHLAFMAALRDNLVSFLKAHKYAPKFQTPAPFVFRDDLLFKWASRLVSEGLSDGHNARVHLIDAVAFAHWLYHGFGNFKDQVFHDNLTVTGFSASMVDGELVCKHDGVVVPSTYLVENWCSWSKAQLGRLIVGPKNLYGHFAAPVSAKPKDAKPVKGGGAGSA